MAFTENLDQFFSADDFAVEAVFTLSNASTRTVKVIFDTPSQSVEIYDTQFEADAPFLRCKTSDVAGITGGTVTVNGHTYKVAKVTKDDGTGVSLVYLKG